MFVVFKKYTKLGITRQFECTSKKDVLEFMREDLRGSNGSSFDAAQAFDHKEPLRVWEIEYTLVKEGRK